MDLSNISTSKKAYFEIKELFEKEKKLFRLEQLYKVLVKKIPKLTIMNFEEILRRYFFDNRLFITKSVCLYGNKKIIKKVKKYLYE